MPSRADTLAEMIDVSTPLATRYFAGFDDSNRAAQPAGMPNHFAWTLGHCAMTMHRLAERLDGQPIPSEDFVEDVEFDEGAPPERFGTEGVCFGSTPVGEADRYPRVSRCVPIFERACERFARAVREAGDDRLAQSESWGTGEMSLADLVVRVNLHNAMHGGQLVDLRRALGLNRVIG